MQSIYITKTIITVTTWLNDEQKQKIELEEPGSSPPEPDFVIAKA